MQATDYTLDSRNARAVRYLQSRPIQIGEPFATRVAMFLDSAGYLSRKQREAIESIIERTGWTEPDPLPPAINDRFVRVFVYVTPGHPTGNDFMYALAARYKDVGKIGVRMMHDPVYKTILEPSDKSRLGVHRLSTSCGTYRLEGTGYGLAGEKRIDPENSTKSSAPCSRRRTLNTDSDPSKSAKSRASTPELGLFSRIAFPSPPFQSPPPNLSVSVPNLRVTKWGM